MAYTINGTTLSTQPENGQWKERTELGKDGNGRPIYAGPREFEMKWGLISMNDWAELRNFFLTIGSTGTVVVELPQYGATSWQFYPYSGCIISEPEANIFFEEYVTDARLIVSKVIT